MIGSDYSFSTLALLACMALLLNLLFGGPMSLYQPLRVLHPMELWRGLVSMMERKFNRAKRNAKTRRRRGWFLLLLGTGVLFLLGETLQQLFTLPGGEYIELLLLTVMLGARPVLDATLRMRRLLKKTPKQIDGLLLPPALVRREHKHYDHASIMRAAIELLALKLSEQVVAPLLAYLLFGWVGVMLVMGVAVMDQLVGYTSSRSREFGQATAIVHSLLQWLPTRTTAVLIAFASLFSPSANPLQSWVVMLAQAGNVKSANAGWPLGAIAGALSLTLGGPRTLHGAYIADGWVGKGRSQPQVADLKRAQWLYAIALLLLLLALLLIGASNI